jgi:hypothetical protein
MRGCECKGRVLINQGKSLKRSSVYPALWIVQRHRLIRADRLTLHASGSSLSVARWSSNSQSLFGRHVTGDGLIRTTVETRDRESQASLAAKVRPTKEYLREQALKAGFEGRIVKPSSSIGCPFFDR